MRDDLLTATYFKGAALDDLWVTWRRADKTLVDFTVAHTYVLTLADRKVPNTTVLTKNTQAHFTGAATDPNLVVAWTTADLNLSPGVYNGLIVATRTSDSKPRKLGFTLHVKRLVGPQ